MSIQPSAAMASSWSAAASIRWAVSRTLGAVLGQRRGVAELDDGVGGNVAEAAEVLADVDEGVFADRFVLADAVGEHDVGDAGFGLEELEVAVGELADVEVPRMTPRTSS